VLRPVAVTIAAALGWVALNLVTDGAGFWLSFFPTIALVGVLVQLNVPGAIVTPVAIGVWLLLPVVVAVFIRWPWWLRWVAVGVAVADPVMLLPIR
jgi:predicted membrane metal-binding protein